MKKLSIFTLACVSVVCFGDQEDMYPSEQQPVYQPKSTQTTSGKRSRPANDTITERRQRMHERRATEKTNKRPFALPVGLNSFGSDTMPAKRKGSYRDTSREVAAGVRGDEEMNMQPGLEGDMVPEGSQEIFYDEDGTPIKIGTIKQTKEQYNRAPTYAGAIASGQCSALSHCPSNAE